MRAAYAMSKFVSVIAGGIGLGYGTYALVQYQEISKLDKAEKSVQKLVETETKNLQSISKTLSEQEDRKNTLSDQIPLVQKAVEASAAELDLARKRVHDLEKAHKSKQEAAAKVVNELESITSKIGSLKRDAERASEASSLGQKSLVIARQQAAEAKKLLNPLNHPRVKSLFGK